MHSPAVYLQSLMPQPVGSYKLHVNTLIGLPISTQGRNGIIGALTEDLIDTGQESDEMIAGLRYTPSGAFGSCRYKLKRLDQNRAEYERLIDVFKAHNYRLLLL